MGVAVQTKIKKMGKKKPLDTILGSFNKTLAELDNLISVNKASIENNELQIGTITRLNTTLQEEKDKAEQVHEKLTNLLNPAPKTKEFVHDEVQVIDE